MRSAVWASVVLCLTVATVAGAASAEETTGYAREGWYLSGLGVWSEVKGDFDGNRVLTGPDVILVPSFDRGQGWGATIGRRENNRSLELNYITTEHNVSFQGARGTARYNVISLDVKRHFRTGSRVQPHLLLGWLPYAWTTVKDGSATRRGVVEDATFTCVGSGVNAGAGLTIYAHPRLFVSATAIYRLILFAWAEGAAGQEGHLDEGLNGSGLSYVGQVGFTF